MKQSVSGGMWVRTYDVLYRAVEEGIEYGWNRAHKHTDTPDEALLKNEILQGVINEVCGVFDFDPKPGSFDFDPDDPNDTEDSEAENGGQQV